MLCMDTFTQKWNTLVMLVSNRPYQQRPYMTSYTVSAITASRVLHSLFVNGQQRLDVKRWTWMKETPNSDLLREGINWRVYFRLGSECRNTVKGPAGEATVLRWTTLTLGWSAAKERMNGGLRNKIFKITNSARSLRARDISCNQTRWTAFIWMLQSDSNRRAFHQSIQYHTVVRSKTCEPSINPTVCGTAYDPKVAEADIALTCLHRADSLHVGNPTIPFAKFLTLAFMRTTFTSY